MNGGGGGQKPQTNVIVLPSVLRVGHVNMTSLLHLFSHQVPGHDLIHRQHIIPPQLNLINFFKKNTFIKERRFVAPHFKISQLHRNPLKEYLMRE